MKPRTFIVFGGCHVAGYGLGNASSFLNHFSRNTGLECISNTGNFQIKKIDEIPAQIEQHNPDIIMLQLGNHEFHASLKKLFRKKSRGNITPILHRVSIQIQLMIQHQSK